MQYRGFLWLVVWFSGNFAPSKKRVRIPILYYQEQLESEQLTPWKAFGIGILLFLWKMKENDRNKERYKNPCHGFVLIHIVTHFYYTVQNLNVNSTKQMTWRWRWYWVKWEGIFNEIRKESKSWVFYTKNNYDQMLVITDRVTKCDIGTAQSD